MNAPVHYPPRWSQLWHLLTGARERGFTEEQCTYLASCIGLAWAKGSENEAEKHAEAKKPRRPKKVAREVIA